MFDFFARDTVIVLSIAAAAVLVALPIQLTLCFKAKKRFVRLIPTVLLGAAAAVFYVMAITARDWDAFAYLIVAVFAGAMFLFCGVAWGIWVIARRIGKKKHREGATLP